ncbi:hypothetical protein D3C73_1300630 [compost metagenome]
MPGTVHRVGGIIKPQRMREMLRQQPGETAVAAPHINYGQGRVQLFQRGEIAMQFMGASRIPQDIARGTG